MNEPFDIPPTPEPIQPGTPKMVPGEERPMSRPEAAYILAKLATSRRVNAGGVVGSSRLATSCSGTTMCAILPTSSKRRLLTCLTCWHSHV